MPAQPVVPFRIRLRGLPPTRCGDYTQVEAGLQRGAAIVQSQPPVGEGLEFVGELRVKDVSATARRRPPVFLGPDTHGPATDRFLYVAWTGETDGVRARFRRLKLPLGGVTWTQIDALGRDPTATLVATVAGRDRHGGPACATVPLLDGGWQVERRSASA
jgi:hypothetical protein